MTDQSSKANDESEWLPFDPRSVYRFLYREKWVILGVSLLIAGSVIGWASRLPKKYEGAVTLQYDPNPPRPLRQDVDDVVDDGSNYAATREWVLTQNQVIKSRAVAERVVERLGLHKDPAFMEVSPGDRARWKGVAVEEAAIRLQRDLKVEQRVDTRIVQVLFVNDDPRKAQLIANTLAEVYVEKTLQDRLGATVEAVSWMTNQLQGVKTELGDAELALHHFKQDHNIVSVSLQDSQNVVAAKMQQFNQALTQARTRRIELAATFTQLEAALTEDPLYTHAEAIDADDNIATLRQRFRDKSAEREALAIKYGENHPSIRAVDAELESLRSLLGKAIQAIVGAARRSLLAAQQMETDLERALGQVQQAGLSLNLREIEYNRLQRSKDNNEKVYGLLLERVTEANLTKLLRVSHVRILDLALKPTKHVSPRMLLISGIAVLAGIFLGFVVAMIHDRLDRTIRSVEAAEALGVTVLGIIPSITNETKQQPNRKRRREVVPGSRDLIVHNSPRSAVAECCRSVRTNLSFLSTDEPVRSIVVTSAGPREGKTTVAVSLAISLAQSGKRILLIDTDLRRPRLHRTFGLPTGDGVTSVIIGDIALMQAAQETAVPNLSVLQCGAIPPNPAELAHSVKFKNLVEQAKQQFDCVILDSPPLGPVIDAAIIAQQVDGAIMVINARHTRRENVVTSLRQLRDANSRVLGAVINDVDIFSHNSGYGSYYYYYQQKPSSDAPGSEGAVANA